MRLFNIFREVLVEQVVKTIDEDQMTAYHGSPHSFDKFSTDYMSTGEGAQAFGWGLYFTDLEDIARKYAPDVNRYKIDVDGKTITGDVAKWYVSNKSNIENEIKELKKDLPSLTRLFGKDFKRDAEELIYAHENDKEIKIITMSNLYKVTLHKGKTPDQYTWLDWDIPVSEKIVETILKYLKSNRVKFRVSNIDGIGRVVNPFGTEDFLKFKTGGEIYTALKNLLRKDKNTLGSPEEVSLFLLRAGIDGIRFPAESIARGKTRDNARGFNYVVFDENAIDVEEKTQFE